MGRYAAIPHSLLDSVAFMGASHLARSLVIELLRQHDGKNNGHLHLSTSWLKRRGWASIDGIQKAKIEVLGRGLVIKTRQGGLNFGPDKYALTWLPITNFIGLDIAQKAYHPGAYLFMNKLPTGNSEAFPPPVRNAAKRTVKRNDCSAVRNNTVPPHGTAAAPTVPPDGTKTTLSGASAVPSDGNNELLPPTFGKLRRVVGVRGRSGKRASTLLHH